MVEHSHRKSDVLNSARLLEADIGVKYKEVCELFIKYLKTMNMCVGNSM